MNNRFVWDRKERGRFRVLWLFPYAERGFCVPFYFSTPRKGGGGREGRDVKSPVLLLDVRASYNDLVSKRQVFLVYEGEKYSVHVAYPRMPRSGEDAGSVDARVGVMGIFLRSGAQVYTVEPDASNPVVSLRCRSRLGCSLVAFKERKSEGGLWHDVANSLRWYTLWQSRAEARKRSKHIFVMRYQDPPPPPSTHKSKC